jgi:hypothetical protein
MGSYNLPSTVQYFWPRQTSEAVNSRSIRPGPLTSSEVRTGIMCLHFSYPDCFALLLVTTGSARRFLRGISCQL